MKAVQLSGYPPK